MATGYDFGDDAVLQMVKANHRPMEQFSKDDGTVPPQLECVCVVDKDPWPCALIKTAREYEKRRKPNQQNPQGFFMATADGGIRNMTGPELHAHRIAEGKIVQ